MKFLVHLHLYYYEMLDEMLNYIHSISDYNYDLYVTLIQDNDNIKQKILHFNANAKIIIVPNKGFDVGPFFEVLNQVILDNYDYIIKLHTKRDLKNGTFLGKGYFKNSQWRNHLLLFLKTKNNFESTLNLFKKNQQIGMMNDYSIILDDKYDGDKVAKTKADEILKNLNLRVVDKKFIAGTMFIAKANLFKILQNKFTIDDFETPKYSGSGSTLAHAFERFFGYFVYSQGYHIKQTKYKCYNICRMHYYLYRTFRFFYQKKITQKNKLIIKICKIPVFNKKV